MELDEADIAILKAVQEDARHSMRQLATLAGVSTPTASAKVKTLEAKGVIKGYHAQVSPEALGEHVLTLFVKTRPRDLEAAAKKLAALPEVRSCKVLSPHVVVALATLLDPALEAEFHAKVAKIQEIGSYDSFLLLRIVKDESLALIDRGAMIAVKCEFCGRRTKDEALRVKVGTIVHYVCCESCKAGFEERSARLLLLAGDPRAKYRQKSPPAEPTAVGHSGHQHP